MTLEFELTWLIGTAVTFLIFVIGAVGGIGKLLLAQAQRHQDERFGVIEAARTEAAQALQALRERIARLESAERSQLSHNDLNAIYNRINGVAENVSQLSGQLSALRRPLEMLQEYLLNKEKA